MQTENVSGADNQQERSCINFLTNIPDFDIYKKAYQNRYR